MEPRASSSATSEAPPTVWHGRTTWCRSSTAPGRRSPDQPVPVDPPFETTWSASDGDSTPDTVDIRGPIETETSEPGNGQAWSLRINEIVFDERAGRGFRRQADGSFTTIVQLERDRDVREHRHDVLLWLVHDRGVAAVDRGTIPGLIDVAVEQRWHPDRTGAHSRRHLGRHTDTTRYRCLRHRDHQTRPRRRRERRRRAVAMAGGQLSRAATMHRPRSGSPTRSTADGLRPRSPADRRSAPTTSSVERLHR